MFELEESPFDIDYVKGEIEFYGLNDYDKDGVRIVTKQLIGRADEFLNKWFWTEEDGLNIPVLFIDNQLWMSLTPMEIQSAFIADCDAEGKVATAGMGMGYFTLKCMENDCVNQIDVYEIDPRIIEFFNKNFSHREGFDKVHIIEGDVRKKLVGKYYDYVFMDPYKTLLPDEVIEDAIFFKKKNKIEEYVFWGYEKVLLNAAILHKKINFEPHLSFTERMLFRTWFKTHRDIAGGVDLPDMWEDHVDLKFTESALKAIGRYKRKVA